MKAGAIGNVLFSRGWYTNSRGTIGKGKEVPAPERLDFSLWQGPAPERPGPAVAAERSGSDCVGPGSGRDPSPRPG